MSNAFEWLSTISQGEFVLDPIGPGRVAPIDPADIAAVAALCLIEDGRQGNQDTLTGNEALTVAEQVRILAEVIGRGIELRQTDTPAQALQSRYPNGAPPALADALIEGLALMRADTIGFRTDTVEYLLGRKPGSFAEWCKRNADTFRVAIGARRPVAIPSQPQPVRGGHPNARIDCFAKTTNAFRG